MALLYLYILLVSLILFSEFVRLEQIYIKKGPVKLPYAYKNKHYEVIIPKRVNSKSQHMTYAMQHYYDNQDVDESDKMDGLHLSVPIEGEQHHVELRPSRSIMSPGMIIETFKHRKHSEFRKPDKSHKKHRRCHFTGRVKGHRRSRAALSTCNGLSGYIQTNSGLFMIEPKYIRDHSLNEPHPHIVYRHRPTATTLATRRDNLFCSTPDTLDGDQPLLKRRRLFQRDSPFLDVGVELNVEVLIVLDQTILHYHKDIDIENYVLTVFNIAHDLFHDSSLNANINLAIVRLIRLEIEDHEMNVAVTHNLDKALQYFRNWQKKINPKEDTHPNHHDMAILLTRMDICSDDKTCGFLGAARMAGMCDPDNEAIIAQDNGLLLGFTIAHEIGHTLNLIHDIRANSLAADLQHLEEDAPDTVMSPHISWNMVEWSNCSRVRLKEYIDYGFGSCLFDAPTEHSFVLADTLPGVMYDADYQCKEMFGPNAALCMTGLECDNLICYVEDKGCVESHMHAAEGTMCGENKWCFHGDCVEVGERPNAVHGQWSNWSEWSECTRTCGSGVASQTRQCNNPAPKFGGKFCDGENIRYKICTTDPCELDQPSFRDIQCAEFDSWVYPGDGQIHQWKSYPMHDENPCALYCVTDNGNVASLRPRVIDGTTCYRGIRDICINGICKEIPCDLDLQSHAVEDRCGVCKGDGTSCDVVRGEKTMLCSEETDSDKQIMVIPEKSVNIKIEEMMPSETRIQVRDMAGTYIFIDGDMLGMYNVHGTKAWVGMIRTKQEAISIQGPLSQKIAIWANVQQNSSLRYSYGMPSKKKRSPVFSWDYLDWSTCSTECGPGTQEAQPKCVEKESGLVDESYCKSLPRLKEQMRPCEIAPCVPRWFVGDWGECQHCPLGIRTRIVKCYRPVGTGEGELDFVSDYLCANNKPKVSEFCSCKQRGKRQDVSTLVTVTNSKAEESTPPVGSNSAETSAASSVTQESVATTSATSKNSEETSTTGTTSSSLESSAQTSPSSEGSAATSPGSAGSESSVASSGASEATTTTSGGSSPESASSTVTGASSTPLSSQSTSPGEISVSGATETKMAGSNATDTTTPGETQRTIEPDTVETDQFGGLITSTEILNTATTPIIKSIFDFVDPNRIKLTVHAEMDKNKFPNGLPHPKNSNESTFDLVGKDALKFLNVIQQDFSNNKTRI